MAKPAKSSSYNKQVPTLGVCPRNFHIDELSPSTAASGVQDVVPRSLIRIANQGLPGELEQTVVTYVRSITEGTLSAPVVLDVAPLGICPTVVTPPITA